MVHGAIGISLLYSWSQSRQNRSESELPAAHTDAHNKFKVVLCHSIKKIEADKGKQYIFGCLHCTDLYGKQGNYLQSILQFLT